MVILADSRYNRQDKRSKLPPWIVQFIRESSLNLSTDLAMDQIRAFLKIAGQPIDQQALKTILYDHSQVVGLAQEFAHTFMHQTLAQPAKALPPRPATQPQPQPLPSEVDTRTAAVVDEVRGKAQSMDAAVEEEGGADSWEELYQREMELLGETTSIPSRKEMLPPPLPSSGNPPQIGQKRKGDTEDQSGAMEVDADDVVYKPFEYPTSVFLFEDILDDINS